MDKRGASCHRGDYKTHDNHVEAFSPDGESLGIVFETATPFDTPRLMTQLVEWTRENLEGGELHKLIVIAVFVVVFLAIHPFQDGNGRLSRILTTLLLMRAGYGYVPYSSEAAKVTGANRNTIKDHLKALTKAGHIERHGASRGTWYGLA